MSKVVCGSCKVEPEVTSHSNGDREAVCPGCGQRDEAQDAIRIAEQHLADEAARSVQSALRGAIKPSKFIKFEAKRIPQRTFRWHLVD
jgi:hypothetical protein